MNKMLVDLHMHSNVSDGLHSPAELAVMAGRSGLQAFALTDHDNLNGLQPAAEAAAKEYVEFVPGVELSAVLDNREVHILGYYPRKLDLINISLEKIRKERYSRMEEIIDRLGNLKFNITLEEVLAEAGTAAPGRLHLARLLFKKKYVHTIDEAFTSYIGYNRPAYVSRKLPGAEEIIAMLLEAYAIPVYAHPGENGKLYLEQLTAMGLLGVEVWHPEHGPGLRNYYEKRGKELGLLLTGGSDYHGTGIAAFDYKIQQAIPAHYLEQLKNAAERLSCSN